MSKKQVTVVGATGIQGSSVVEALLKDNTYNVRGLTLNIQSDSSKALAGKGAEMMQADANDYESLVTAFEDSYAIYAVTDFFEYFSESGPESAMEIEYQQGTNLAKAASVTPTLEHYVWSTLPDASSISGGKYVIPHFESKNRIDRFIKSNTELFTKTTFLWTTFCAANYFYPMFKPYHIPTADKYVQFQSTPADVPILAMGNTRANAGLFVSAVLLQPEKTRDGKIVLAYVEKTTMGGLLEVWGKTQGKKVQYAQIDKTAFRALWPVWAEEMGTMMEFWDWAREKSWTAEQTPLTAADLGIEGLGSVEEAFNSLTFE
ncbi:NmrA-like family protein-like protein [Dactylonectria estremocensis]|uniref:NmrA-like family protein-like protein n=1 Tax=Dactylonectria estremocensis TaxID=1079267 RepID=A0A9P9ENQ4_9HYPO|nr:NmrA-like family protein-like protein [Dactylonectria estremocensis]